MKKHKLQLEKITEAYQRAEEPRDSSTLEYVRAYEKDAIALTCSESFTVIVLGKGTVAPKRMVAACHDVSKLIGKKADKYFITSYA